MSLDDGGNGENNENIKRNDMLRGNERNNGIGRADDRCSKEVAKGLDSELSFASPAGASSRTDLKAGRQFMYTQESFPHLVLGMENMFLRMSSGEGDGDHSCSEDTPLRLPPEWTDRQFHRRADERDVPASRHLEEPSVLQGWEDESRSSDGEEECTHAFESKEKKVPSTGKGQEMPERIDRTMFREHGEGKLLPDAWLEEGERSRNVLDVVILTERCCGDLQVVEAVMDNFIQQVRFPFTTTVVLQNTVPLV